MNEERPILFLPEMVMAILEDRKTQTRRIIKQINPEWVLNPVMEKIYTGILQDPFPWRALYRSEHIDRWGVFIQLQDKIDDTTTEFYPCPYGNIGWQLWVRETWQTGIMYDNISPSCLNPDDPIQYKTGNNNHPVSFAGKGRASIHMPRWASRINLKITDIRVERIRDISDEDIIAEGILGDSYLKEAGITKREPMPARVYFAGLWDSINAKRGYGWEVNPYVWVIKFKRLRKSKEK